MKETGYTKMMEKIYDDKMSIRVTDKMRIAIEEAARKEGITYSDFIRNSIETELLRLKIAMK